MIQSIGLFIGKALCTLNSYPTGLVLSYITSTSMIHYIGKPMFLTMCNWACVTCNNARVYKIRSSFVKLQRYAEITDMLLFFSNACPGSCNTLSLPPSTGLPLNPGPPWSCTLIIYSYYSSLPSPSLLLLTRGQWVTEVHDTTPTTIVLVFC